MLRCSVCYPPTRWHVITMSRAVPCCAALSSTVMPRRCAVMYCAVQAVDLSAEQRAAVHLVWQRVKSSTTELTQQYEQLQQQLQEVHVGQLQKYRQFETETKQLPGLQAVHSRAERAWQERKQQEQLQQQIQQQQEQASTPDAGGAYSPAHSAAKEAGSAVAGGPGHADSASNSSSGSFALTPGIHSSTLAEAEEVLLQVGYWCVHMQ